MIREKQSYRLMAVLRSCFGTLTGFLLGILALIAVYYIWTKVMDAKWQRVKASFPDNQTKPMSKSEKRRIDSIAWEIRAQKSSLVLNLSGNSLSVLPDTIRLKSNTLVLDLRGNDFSKFPAKLQKLEILQDLYLAANNFSSWPEEIESFKHLQLLDLSNNRIANVPESIEKLQNLRTLYLSHNRITSLPASIEKLRKLEAIYLSGNAFTLEQIEALRMVMPWCKVYW